MNGATYKNTNNDIKVNKTPQKVKDVTFDFLDDISLISPHIVLKKNSVNVSDNYFRIDYSDTEKYYYFIRDKILMRGGMCKLILELDELYTFKNDILNATAYIERTQSKSLCNLNLNDAYLPILSSREVTISKPFGGFSTNLYNYIVVVGGGVQ